MGKHTKGKKNGHGVEVVVTKGFPETWGAMTKKAKDKKPAKDRTSIFEGVQRFW